MSADLMEDDRRCRATSKGTGRRCRRFPVPGAAVCVIHGGAAPSVRAAAERRRAEAEATALLEQVWDPNAEPVSNVVEALHKMAGRIEHAVNVLGARVSTEGLDGAAATAWNQVLGHQRRLLADIARLGIEARMVELEQARAEMVVAAFLAAVDSLALLPADRTRAVEVFLGELETGRSRPRELGSGEAS